MDKVGRKDRREGQEVRRRAAFSPRSCHGSHGGARVPRGWCPPASEHSPVGPFFLPGACQVCRELTLQTVYKARGVSDTHRHSWESEMESSLSLLQGGLHRAPALCKD